MRTTQKVEWSRQSDPGLLFLALGPPTSLPQIMHEGMTGAQLAETRSVDDVCPPTQPHFDPSWPPWLQTEQQMEEAFPGLGMTYSRFRRLLVSRPRTTESALLSDIANGTPPLGASVIQSIVCQF